MDAITKLKKHLIAVLSFLLAISIATQERLNYKDLKVFSLAIVDSIHESGGRRNNIQIRLENSFNKYIISGDEYDCLSKYDFLTEVKEGDYLEIMYTTPFLGYNYSVRDILFNEKSYIDFECANNYRINVKALWILRAILFCLIIVLLISYFKDKK